MADISTTIEAKSDQLNADDLLAGPRIITVKSVQIKGNDKQPVSIFFYGDNGKPFKPCKTMRRLLVLAWGNESQNYIDRSMRVYRDPTVIYGGDAVGGIRISHLSHIDDEQRYMLTIRRGQKSLYTVALLLMDKIIDSDVFAKACARADLGLDVLQQWWKTNKKYQTMLQGELKNLKARASSAVLSDPHWTEEINAASFVEGSVQWGEGQAAKQEGKPRTACPYYDEPELAASWIGGWEENG